MRVFILQFSNRYDVSTVKNHGTPLYLLSEQLNPFEPNEAIMHIRNGLSRSKFNPQEDAVALTGASNLVSLFLSVLIYDYTKIKVLIFEPKTEQYVLKIIDMKNSNTPL